jgi:hypothetical protein
MINVTGWLPAVDRHGKTCVVHVSGAMPLDRAEAWLARMDRDQPEHDYRIVALVERDEIEKITPVQIDRTMATVAAMIADAHEGSDDE